MFPYKYLPRLQRKIYARTPSVNNSFSVSNLNNSQAQDPVKPGHVWLLFGWEFHLAGAGVSVEQISTAVHLCPPGTLPTVFPEGLIATPANDPGTFQLEFGFQSADLSDIGGSFLGSTTGKWPLVVPEDWFVAAYFISSAGGSLAANVTTGSLKLLVIDLSQDELCKLK